MSELTESQIRHLEAVQRVITRLAGNSFALKALAGTISAAVIAFAGSTEETSPLISLAGILPAVVFWLMDAQYLRLEKRFRALHDDIQRGVIEQPFSMDASSYNVGSIFTIAWSWSVKWFYLALVVALVAVAIVD